ncbi:glyoxylate/hydroxypyruvate reductase A [Catalinimonas alkaloidigena]|uniref:2-hydroxyacid dehydrogenase n=1 Tax=Catalinimonas alkaloidigena TaxID=1075417 RepID=UPI0024053D6B|nr:glyoxylate/hydroxypyruvate reductase A [Catalinimonas alkaloidigena]MDF9797362.1 glyoxylate/hydroxypyruvate reductase A [Catalinimonas alkaloidigena]
MSIVLIFNERAAEPWKNELQKIDPNLRIDVWPEVQDPSSYTTAVVWKHPRGTLHQFSNLRLIHSLGAGVDHILSDPDLPQANICRIIDDKLAADMSNFIIAGTINFQRNLKQIWLNQQNKVWDKILPVAHSIRIGILGLGALGQDVAMKLTQLGFAVYGYSQSPKKLKGINTFTGEKELQDMLKQVNVIVCLLPLTTKTKNILNHSLFLKLQRGSYLINVARGEHLVEEDLIQALEEKQLSGALLDVFRDEPLPRNHPFWEHPDITVTPHIASITDTASAAQQIVVNHRRILNNQAPLNQIDPDKEY